MASRCRSLSRPAFSLIRSTVTKPSSKPKPSPFLHNTRSSVPVPVPRSVPYLGSVQSLLPLHSAVSSARLTSCLGIDSRNSRSMTQGAFKISQPPKKWASAHLDKRFRKTSDDEL